MNTQARQALVDDRAQALWASFDDNEQFGVRFGLFPADKMRAAEAEGFTSRELTLALMAIATKKGGMRA
jgi:hypothetical protein